MQQHDPSPRAFGEVWIGFEMGIGAQVQRLRTAELEPGRIQRLVDDLLDQHPELRTPIADVVLRYGAVPKAGKDSTQTVADDGGPEMSDMHLFGHVRSGVVDHHNLRVGGLRHPDVRVGELIGHRLGQYIGPKPEVDKARPSDLRRLAQISNLELGNEAGSNLTRGLAFAVG